MEKFCNKTNNMHLENRQDEFSFHADFKGAARPCKSVRSDWKIFSSLVTESIKLSYDVQQCFFKLLTRFWDIPAKNTSSEQDKFTLWSMLFMLVWAGLCWSVMIWFCLAWACLIREVLLVKLVKNTNTSIPCSGLVSKTQHMLHFSARVINFCVI